jgi:hypothetical protein
VFDLSRLWPAHGLFFLLARDDVLRCIQQIHPTTFVNAAAKKLSEHFYLTLAFLVTEAFRAPHLVAVCDSFHPPPTERDNPSDAPADLLEKAREPKFLTREGLFMTERRKFLSAAIAAR